MDSPVINIVQTCHLRSWLFGKESIHRGLEEEDGKTGGWGNKNQSELHWNMLFSLYSRNRFLSCI
jgi:hypothetical protein